MNEPMRILMAEDDDDDFLLTQKALEAVSPGCQLHRVKDGEELMRFLNDRSKEGLHRFSKMFVIFLDLNMPRKDGREALREIRADLNLRTIPVIVFTTSRAEKDILDTCRLGANTYMCKPDTFEEWTKLMETVRSYWFGPAHLPALDAK